MPDMPDTLNADPDAAFLESLDRLDREIAEQNTIAAAACSPSPDEELDQQIQHTEKLLARLRERRHRRQVYQDAAPVGIGPVPDFRPDPHVDRSTSQAPPDDEDPERFEDPALNF